MLRRLAFVVPFVSISLALPVSSGAAAVLPGAIVCDPAASPLERLAAKEIRRYVYLRSGRLLSIVAEPGAHSTAIVVGTKDRPAVLAASGKKLQSELGRLGPEQYRLVVDKHAIVAGGCPLGTLYGAYRLAERLGVRFYLEGDVVPDGRIEPALPALDEAGKPLFDRRGIQPFHDFPEGPDWWNADGYKAVLAQLPKLRMNFFGLHNYPEGGVGPEPLVWIGLAEDILPDARVRFSYPARHFTTLNGTWGYRAMPTGRYVFGAAALYDRDDDGADYMRGMAPWPPTPEASNELFARTGRLLADCFGFAHGLGIKTCMGTETPLTIPKLLQQRLKAAGRDPADLAVVQSLYEGMFRRIAQTQALDYYWFWTPEGWTWQGTKPEQVQATLADIRAAIAAAETVKAPFTLATCGWVLGPPHDRALFDKVLPKQMPVSCINRQVGHDPVEPGFAKVHGRPKWAIPWMEDDPALASPQLWVGRMRRDAADALAYGCTGLMGIHWRTRILGPNVSALAAAAWEQKAWNPHASGRPLPPPPRPPRGPDGGKFAAFPRNKIEGTAEPSVYQTVRYDVAAYHLDVPDGLYTVTLKFCEPHYRDHGRRVFGVSLQGQTVIDRLDIFAKVGRNRALDFTFKDVRVDDGRLSIEFIPESEFPAIAAIVVDGPVTRKINCGGTAWRDYQADWPASATGARKKNFLPAADFYADWAAAAFGREAAKPIAALLTKIDGQLPRPSDWVNGPGGIKPDPRPWAEVAKDYAFVEELAGSEGKVHGAGSRERFAYWLDNFRYMRANARLNCAWGRLNAALARAKAEKDPAACKRLAELALPIRREMIGLLREVHRHLLATVTTAGELGTVTNWQQHIMPMAFTVPGEELAKLLGAPLPADCVLAPDCPALPRLVVPVVRSSLLAGEPLRVTAMVIGGQPEQVVLAWRGLGTGEYTRVPLAHVSRGVYAAAIPPEKIAGDLEYCVEARLAGGPKLVFPASSPEINQTVVVMSTGE